MSIFDDSRCAENQVDDREPEPAQGDASGEAKKLASEIYHFIDSKVYHWLRRDDGTPDPTVKQAIMDWLVYKLGNQSPVLAPHPDAEVKG